MGHAILISSRNFPVNTDRWAAAAVVAIDPLRRKMSGATETKRQNMTMSDNFDLHNPFKPVDSMHGDAIGDDGPAEHETVFARDQDGGHLGKRPLTPTSSKTGKHATKSPFGPHYGNSNWTPERKREAAGDEAPTSEHVNARKKGKSALDASPGVETPRKHDAPSKQSDRDGSPPPAPKEAEVENRANSDDEDARKVEIAQYAEPHWRDKKDWGGVDVDYSLVRLQYQPFKELDIVFAKVEGVWYAGSISKIIKRSRYGYYIHTYAEDMLKDMYKRDLLLFTKEAFERMAADATNLECAEARLCLYYAAIEYNCKCKHFQRKIKLGEEWRNLNTNIPKRLHDKVRSTVWYKDLMERHNQLKLVEGTRP